MACVKNLYMESNIKSFMRFINSSAVRKSDNFEEMGIPIRKKVQKVSALKTRFPSDKQGPPKIVEGKYAASVIKKFNWESKHLFGPLLIKGKTEKIIAPIIQHQNVPVVEPLVQPKYDSVIPHSNNWHSNVYETLLNFPLVNKPKTDEKARSIQISELNILRTELEKMGHYYKPSVTTILDKTMSKESVENLRRWKQKMINELGDEGFQKYQSELLENGTALHDYINRYLSSTQEEKIKNVAIQGYVTSLKSVFPCISEIKLVEEKISHPFLHYKGVVDCYAKYRDQLVVIEWKTSKKTKSTLSNTFDNPLQVAAYVGALNFDPKFQYLAKKGLLVIAYENGNPASLLMINEERMLHYWKEWLKRLKLYWETINSNPNLVNKTS